MPSVEPKGLAAQESTSETSKTSETWDVVKRIEASGRWESYRLYHIAGFSSLYESLRLEDIIELLIQHSMRRCPIAACNLQLLQLQPLQPLTPPWYTQFSLLISPCTAQIAHGFLPQDSVHKGFATKDSFLRGSCQTLLPLSYNPNLPTPAVALKRFARIQNQSTQSEARHIPTTISIVGQTMKSMNTLARSKTNIPA